MDHALNVFTFKDRFEVPALAEKQRKVVEVLELLPEVRWDRWAGELEFMGVFGWLPRADGKADFIQITIEDFKVVGFSTSSAKHSSDFAQRLGLAGVHSDCKRVEHWFPVENCIRL